MKENIEFICSLPDVGFIGGETKKNQYLLNFLKKNSNPTILDVVHYTQKISRSNFKILFKIFLLLKCIKSIISPFSKKIIISLNSKVTYKYLILCYFFNFLKKDIYYLVVGGSFHKCLGKEFKLKYYKNINKIYVESKIMKEEIKKKGLYNVEYLPNFKSFKIKKRLKNKVKLPIKAVFFSRVVKEKGTELIFNMLKEINKEKILIKVDFWGPIESEYENEFNKKVKLYIDREYRGVLDIDKEESYDILANYDIMLFPTYWEGEGFPGVIIDAFIAGLPVVASNWNYNKEILNDKVSFIFESKNQQEFTEIIKKIIKNVKLIEVKQLNCFNEAKKYEIDNLLKGKIFKV